MTDQFEYAVLDKPEILSFFFYPRRGASAPPAGARDHLIPVDGDVCISCRFYHCGSDSASILLFHGFSETVSDYDPVAPLYGRMGVSLFVADYRGYGCSGGVPTFSNMVADAHRVFDGFQGLLRREGHTGRVFLMGRSLGSAPAIDLAARHGQEIAGLIIEGGFATMCDLMTVSGLPPDSLGMQDPGFPNLSMIRAVKSPILILHGEEDSLIPLVHARDLFDNAPARDKRLVVIPGASHNELIDRNAGLYFRAISSFILGA